MVTRPPGESSPPLCLKFSPIGIDSTFWLLARSADCAFRSTLKDRMELLWGIDLGGTKIECVVSAAENILAPVARVRAPTEAQFGYDRVLHNTASLVEKVSSQLGTKPTRLGISCCGTVKPSDGSMKNCNATCLNGRPFRSDLEKLLGIEAVFANDANCFALAEARLGAGRGANVVFGVILGSGVGGGVVVNSEVLNGSNGIAGEWGHNVLEEDGPKCYCGKSGCVERIISGPALEAYYESLAGEKLPLKEIENQIDQGNPAALKTFERLIWGLGKSLAVVINILDPDVIVLGGGVSKISRIYEAVGAEVAKHVFSDEIETRIVQHQLGDSAGVFGALMLVG